jgi:hypothetical protein
MAEGDIKLEKAVFGCGECRQFNYTLGSRIAPSEMVKEGGLGVNAEQLKREKKKKKKKKKKLPHLS